MWVFDVIHRKPHILCLNFGVSTSSRTKMDEDDEDYILRMNNTGTQCAEHIAAVLQFHREAWTNLHQFTCAILFVPLQPLVCRHLEFPEPIHLLSTVAVHVGQQTTINGMCCDTILSSLEPISG